VQELAGWGTSASTLVVARAQVLVLDEGMEAAMSMASSVEAPVLGLVQVKEPAAWGSRALIASFAPVEVAEESRCLPSLVLQPVVLPA
jgi:hypothetical protein